MSLSSIMNIGVSGLMTAQDQLRLTSDNISNVNTPGYIRKVSQQQSVVVGGKGMGVTTGQVTLAADKYLQAASLKASSASAQSDTAYDLLDQIQSQFGDLTDTNNLFNQAASALSSMAQAAEDPTSSAGRQQVLSNVASFLSEGSRIAGKIQTIRGDADSRISADVNSVNDLLKSISDLNSTISGATVAGDDATGAQTTQMQYIDQLSKLLDVNVTQNANGGVTVRTQSGLYLTGDKYATLSYQAAASVDATTSFNGIVVTGVNGEQRDLADNLASGEIKGLLDTRDNTAVAVNDQLNQYMGKFADAMNAAHNASSAVPAPASLTGKDLSQTAVEALGGFTGKTNLVTLDSSGNITHKMAIDFDAGTYSLDGGAASTFTASSFASDITAGFGGAATLTFLGGRMSLAASGSGGNAGVGVVDPSSGGSQKLGQGFSQFFGLNDFITSDVPTNPQTGLTAGSQANFSAGQIGFSLKSAAGATLSNVSFTMPTGGTMSDLVSALNDTNTGVGRYGTFSLDGNGALTFQGFGNPANTLGVTSDSTSRLGGASFSQFFGLAGNASNIAGHLQIADRIYNDPAQMAMAQVNLSPGSGNAALISGDGSGGQAMADIASQPLTFAKTGLNSGGQSTLERYGSDLAGQVGNLAANAKTTKDSNTALTTEATSRRNAYEGVNLDEELVNLTTYQQGYSAAGRLIQAAKDMYDVLLNMI